MYVSFEGVSRRTSKLPCNPNYCLLLHEANVESYSKRMLRNSPNEVDKFAVHTALTPEVSHRDI